MNKANFRLHGVVINTTKIFVITKAHERKTTNFHVFVWKHGKKKKKKKKKKMLA